MSIDMINNYSTALTHPPLETTPAIALDDERFFLLRLLSHLFSAKPQASPSSTAQAFEPAVPQGLQPLHAH